MNNDSLRSWRTTGAGLGSLLTLLLVKFGIELSPEIEEALATLIPALGLALLGWFSKDHKVTHAAETDAAKTGARPTERDHVEREQ